MGDGKREVVAWAITHAPRGQKGGPYEAARGGYGVAAASLDDAARWRGGRPRKWTMRNIRKVVPHARVIRIVRKARPFKESEPIIIETPALPTRERLVLVPPGTCTDYVDKPGLVRLVTTDARDATPADLARAGYERLGPEVLRVSAAEWHAMKLRAEGREAPDDTHDAHCNNCGAWLGDGTIALCTKPPDGWSCSRKDGHDGPCAARRKQPEKGRATDEELASLAAAQDFERGEPSPRNIARAVAARVRQERCLVAQAVGTNVDIRVCEDDGGGFMVGVHAPGCDEELTRYVPPADVPATLARLLGEVSRG